jgi:hypothetical protein
MPLADYSVVFNGLTIGAGTNFVINNIEGLGGTSPLRIQDDNRGYLDGSYTGRDFYDERTVYIDVTVLGSGSTTAQANYVLLQKAFAPQPVGYYPDPTGYSSTGTNELKLFQFRLNANTGDKNMYGRSRGIITPINPNFTYGYIETRIQMTFPDPRYYDATQTTSSASVVSVSNTGWATSCPRIVVSTPSATGYITDNSTFMRFTNASGAGSLVIDLLQRVVYLGGIPTRNILIASSNGWLDIAPNTTSKTWTSTIGNMVVSYQNAYV